MSAPRLLFVDDEPHFLEGLRDLLRRRRHEWEARFVRSGAAALEELARDPFDLVLTDLQMPGMGGVELLQRVRSLQPGATRLVLSGATDRAALGRALLVAHRFIAKPCDAGRLQTVIERTLALRALLGDPALRRRIGDVERLPSPPAIYGELLAVAARPDSGASDVAAVLQRDPAMAAKVLQVVNSAAVGLCERVVTVGRAVSFLGVELVKGLALASDAFGCAALGTLEHGFVESTQRHSLAVAQVARRIVVDRARADEAFVAGIVHEVGALLLAAQGALPAGFAAQLGSAALLERERAEWGVTHGEVGAYLLGSWGLPHAIVDAVARHHRPVVRAGPPDAVELALHVADALVEELEAEGEPARLDRAALEAAGVVERLPDWRAVASAVVAPSRVA